MPAHHFPQSAVISIEVDGHIATVWLDRAEKRNAFAPAFWDDLPPIMESLGDDPSIRVIIIAARGSAFTVGIDLKAFGPSLMAGGGVGGSEDQPTSDVANRRDLYQSVKKLQRTFTSIADCPKPVIAAVHGYCIGAGVALITACDIRFASQDAVFSVRETQMAMVADVGTMQRLPKIIDPGRVAELVFTGKDFGAAEAFEMGLITRVAADADDVQNQAMGVAKAIAANSPLAVQGSKAVLKAGEGRSIEEALDYVALWNSSFIASNDFTDAITAFLEKRPPKFMGD